MGDEVKLPFSLTEFVSSARSIASIIAVLTGLIAWAVNQHNRINYLEAREKDHPTKSELAETAIRIDNRILVLEAEHREASRRLNDMQNEMGKNGHEVSIITERQNRVIKDFQAMNERIDRIVQALDSTYGRLTDFITEYNRNRGGGERGPTAPLQRP